LNRFPEAKKVAETALQQGFTSQNLRRILYSIGFINADNAAMQEQLSKLPRATALYLEADTELFRGQWKKWEELLRRADREAATNDADGDSSHTTAFVGAVLNRCSRRADYAPDRARSVGKLESHGVAAGLCVDRKRAETIIGELANAAPNDLLVNARVIPEIKAAIGIRQGNSQTPIDVLDPARPYDSSADFLPQYLRGLAYLQMKSGRLAVSEFRRILDHRGQAPLSVLYPLAHLGLARAVALTGDTPTALKAYEEFFTLWGDADPDLPPLQAARHEFNSLQTSRGTKH
jgi:eukaryotic-like serine/threonine-protein kinase